MDDILNSVSVLVEMAKIINKNNRDKNKNYRGHYSPKDWLRSFCTIHINTGRATGKTYYIKTHAESGDVVVLNNLTIKKELIYYFLENDKTVSVILAEDVAKYKSKDMPNRVFIDEPESCFRKIDYENLLNIFLDIGKDQTVIMLGE